jgi:hypothetical protein
LLLSSKAVILKKNKQISGVIERESHHILLLPILPACYPGFSVHQASYAAVYRVLLVNLVITAENSQMPAKGSENG